jgi:hypothetical protein
MQKTIGFVLLIFAAHSAVAKENWPLTVNVLSSKNLENPHGTFRLSWGGGSGGAGWTHRIAEHAFVEASDGNSYELVPQNPKDMLLPGKFQAKIEKRDMKVCEPKNNGNCREVKFKIVAAVPTARANESAPEEADAATSGGGSPRKPNLAPARQAVDPPADAQAVLSVESTPSGADIEIDGSFVGNTPSTVTVPVGSHDISVKKKGFTDWTKKLSVTGGSIHLTADLEEAPKP